jgi:hypothetical protein
LSDTLAVGNSAGTFNINMNQNEIQNVKTMTMRDDTDDQPDIIFTKTGTQRATISYNGSGLNDQLNMVGNSIALDGAEGNLELTAGNFSRLSADGIKVQLYRRTALLADDTTLTLNAAGEVAIGDPGLTTTPSLKLQGATNSFNIAFDNTNNRADVTGLLRFPTTLPQSALVPALGDELVNKTYVDGQPTPTLSAVLTAGNNGGGNAIVGVSGVTAQGATPEFRLNDAGGTPAAGLAFTDATDLTELYCIDDLEIGPGGNTTINAGTGAFEFKNGGTQNFLVSGGGNTMRLNAPTGGQTFELNTAAISQQSELKFIYGTPGSGTGGFGIYRPTNTRSLAFYNYNLARNQMLLDSGSGFTEFKGAGGSTVASVWASGAIESGSTTAGIAGDFRAYNTMNDTFSSGIGFRKSVNGGNTIVNTELGYIDFIGYANSAYRRGALIYVVQEAASAGNNIPCSMRFFTTATLSPSGAQERMRITQDGFVGINTITPATPLHVVGTTRLLAATTDGVNAALNIAAQGTGVSIEAFQGNAPGTKRNIFLNGFGGTVAIGNTAPPAVPGLAIYAADDLGNSWNGFSYFGNTTSRGVIAGALIVGATRRAIIGGHTANLGAWDKLTVNAGANVGIGAVYDPTFQLELGVDSAAKPTTNTWTIISDERIKKNVVDADLGLCYENLKSMRLRRYEWDPEYYDDSVAKDRHALGFIAQEVKTKFPKAVDVVPVKTFDIKQYDLSGNVILDEETHLPKTITKTLENCHSLNTDQIEKTHIGATQMLIQKVEALETQNAAILAQNAALLARLEALEAKA